MLHRSPRSIWRLTLLALWLSSCGGNVYKPLVKKQQLSEKAYLQDAKMHLDKQEYSAAADDLSHVTTASAEKLKLQIGVILGTAGLDFWTMILSVVDKLGKTTTASSSNSGNQGSEQLFSLLTDSVFGTANERQARITALGASISAIENAGTIGAQFESLRCLLTGILVLPSVTDGAAAMQKMGSALENILANVQGTGATASECPGLSDFTTVMGSLSTVQQSMELVLKQTSSCSMLNFLQSNADISSVALRLKKFIVTADKGCPEILTNCSGILCQALQFGCVREVLGSTAVAGDGVVEPCELVFNCQGSDSCF